MGEAMTVKSAAFAPVINTLGLPVNCRAPVPVLRMTKVFVMVPEQCDTEPKFVLFSAEVLRVPLAMDLPFPVTSISGVVTVTVCTQVLEFPYWSVAVHTTLVVPNGKVEPV